MNDLFSILEYGQDQGQHRLSSVTASIDQGAGTPAFAGSCRLLSESAGMEQLPLDGMLSLRCVLQVRNVCYYG